MNNKKKVILLCLVCICLLFTGCESSDKDEAIYKVYYVNTEGTALVESGYQPEAETFDAMMEELIGQLSEPPVGYNTPLTGKTSIVGYERGIDALRIDFTKDYYKLTNVEEVLLRAAVVKTFIQVPGVTNVMITVNKVQLTTADGIVIPAMNQNSFIQSKNGGINSYIQANLNLYFQDTRSGLLHCEERDLHYPSNMMLERVIIEQIMAGSDNEDLVRAFDSSTKVLGINTKDGICTINLSKEADQINYGTIMDPEMTLYAIVDSICASIDTVTGVKFEIEGESDILFRKEVDLKQVFEMNEKLTESGNSIPVNHSVESVSDTSQEGVSEEKDQSLDTSDALQAGQEQLQDAVDEAAYQEPSDGSEEQAYAMDADGSYDSTAEGDSSGVSDGSSEGSLESAYGG